MVLGHQMGDFVVDVIVVAVFPIGFEKVMLSPGGHDAHHVTSSIAKAKPIAQARAISAKG